MSQNIKIIQTNILSRYKTHWRKLPRRKIYPANGGARDPYAIHVSEVMLQQTQVERVIPYFHQRMKDFPDYKTLAKASKTDVLRHRSGLGFNSRALRLQNCAKIVSSSKYQVISTKSRSELQKLPGIGPYTSAAIMAFAWNLEVPVIDTNIRRVLIFLFKLNEKISASELETFAEKIIPKWKSRDRHNALMDYGALELTARKTKIKSLSKQSKFEWSDREVRWWAMKQLVKHGKITLKTVEEEFPKKDVKNILKFMEKEWLISIVRSKIQIKE